MALSDKVRQVAFTLAAGSIGVGIGYVANEIGERRRESAAKEEAHRQHIEVITNRYLPLTSNYQPLFENSGHCSGGISCAF